MCDLRVGDLVLNGFSSAALVLTDPSADRAFFVRLDEGCDAIGTWFCDHEMPERVPIIRVDAAGSGVPRAVQTA